MVPNWTLPSLLWTQSLGCFLNNISFTLIFWHMSISAPSHHWQSGADERAAICSCGCLPCRIRQCPNHTKYHLQLASVLQIAPEVLGLIFQQHINVMFTEGDDGECHPTWYLFSHVCSWWQTVALGNPSLWSHVSFPYPLWLKETLKQVKMVPVVVHISRYWSICQHLEQCSLCHHTVHISRNNLLHMLSACGGFGCRWDVNFSSCPHSCSRPNPWLAVLIGDGQREAIQHHTKTSVWWDNPKATMCSYWKLQYTLQIINTYKFGPSTSGLLQHTITIRLCKKLAFWISNGHILSVLLYLSHMICYNIH